MKKIIIFAAICLPLCGCGERGGSVQEAHQKCNPTHSVEKVQVSSCEIDAASGNRDAQAVMCGLYHSGTFVQKDLSSAANWCLKAAKQGDKGAQMMLGRIYAKGEGVPKNNVEAYAWFSVAATSNSNDKFEHLARLGKSVLSPQMTAEEKRRGEIKSSAYIAEIANQHQAVSGGH